MDCVLMNFDNYGYDSVSILNTGGRFLSAGKDYPPQCGHSNCPTNREKISVYFMKGTASEPTSTLLCTGSHTFLFYRPAS